MSNSINESQRLNGGARILFQLSGSIACYKACQVISRLVQAGHEVQVVTTRSALEFVGAATLEGLTGKPILSEVFKPGSYMDHIHLAKWADLVVLCPASANTINKLANGIGDDLVSTLFLAHDFAKPYLLVPAMNTKMYQHPATQASLVRLQGWGVRVLETASGVLACGDVGSGRLLEPDLILEEIKKTIQGSPLSRASRELKILITSGGTRESIDGVRSIANTSTGRTGATIADHLAGRGHKITFLHARESVLPKANASLRPFTRFSDLEKELKTLLATDNYDAVIHAAAVSDFSVGSISIDGKDFAPTSRKIDSIGEVTLKLRTNPKLLPLLKTFSSRPLVVVGFKLTNGATVDEKKAAVKKAALGTDLIVQNDLNEITENSHPTHFYVGDREVQKFSTKKDLAVGLEEFLLKAAVPYQVRTEKEVRA